MITEHLRLLHLLSEMGANNDSELIAAETALGDEECTPSTEENGTGYPMRIDSDDSRSLINVEYKLRPPE